MLTMKKIIVFLCAILSATTMMATYSDSILVLPTESIGSNIENYTFSQHDITVSCTKGARYADYFGCNASQSITFSANENIKCIRINGFVKKNFDATASSGDLHYLSSYEDNIEANPVLIIYDIDAPSITINCGAQLRCYEVAVFFSRNTMDSLPSEDYGWDYSAEIPIPVTHDITFTQVQYNDWTADYSLFYLQFTNEDGDLLDLNIDLSYNDPQTGIPAGTYPFSMDYAEGYAEASWGNADGYDYPSYYIDNTLGIYYLVDGTVTVAAAEQGTQININATSYYGSTINATYTGALVNELQGIDNTTSNPSDVSKKLHNGQITIHKNNRTYSILGIELK